MAFGEDDARVLLGAYTLEGLRLAVDPTHARLIPATNVWASTPEKRNANQEGG